MNLKILQIMIKLILRKKIILFKLFINILKKMILII